MQWHRKPLCCCSSSCCTENFVLTNFIWHQVDQSHLASYVTDINPKVQQQIRFMTYPCDGPDPNNQAAVMFPGRQVLVLSMMISSVSFEFEFVFFHFQVEIVSTENRFCISVFPGWNPDWKTGSEIRVQNLGPKSGFEIRVFRIAHPTLVGLCKTLTGLPRTP
jgi:hypothetical protein